MPGAEICAGVVGLASMRRRDLGSCTQRVLQEGKTLACGRDQLRRAIGSLSAAGVVEARAVEDPFPDGRRIRRVALVLVAQAAA